MKARPAPRLRKSVSHYLTPDTVAALARLAEVRGQSASRVLEALIAEESKREYRVQSFDAAPVQHGEYLELRRVAITRSRRTIAAGVLVLVVAESATPGWVAILHRGRVEHVPEAAVRRIAA